MKLAIIILGVIILVLVCVVAWLVVGVNTLDERCHKLEVKDLRNASNIMDIGSKVDLLNDIYNARKALELMAERKEKMADYLVVHAGDSVTNRASALYDIATGKIIKEDKE